MFLIRLFAERRPTLNLGHTSSGNLHERIWEKEVSLPVRSPTLTAKFVCPVAAAGMKSNYFRISVHTEDQKLSRNPSQRPAPEGLLGYPASQTELILDSLFPSLRQPLLDNLASLSQSIKSPVNSYIHPLSSVLKFSSQPPRPSLLQYCKKTTPSNLSQSI